MFRINKTSLFTFSFTRANPNSNPNPNPLLSDLPCQGGKVVSKQEVHIPL